MIKAVGVVIVILALFFLGSKGAATDEIVVRVAIIAVVVLLIPLFYVWKFVSRLLGPLLKFMPSNRS